MSWTIQEGIGLARILEPVMITNGYHVALGGSVLHSGVSDKDCDFVIYKRTKAKKHVKPSEIVTSLTEIGFVVPLELGKSDDSGGDNRQIFKLEYHERRVD